MGLQPGGFMVVCDFFLTGFEKLSSIVSHVRTGADERDDDQCLYLLLVVFRLCAPLPPVCIGIILACRRAMGVKTHGPFFISIFRENGGDNETYRAFTFEGTGTDRR